jgi:hypothetical protein
MPHLRRKTSVNIDAIERLAVTPKVAGAMLGYGKTRIFKLLKNGELDSFVDGGARRVLTASIKAYIERRLAASKEVQRAHRGPYRTSP